jgi:5-formyltetrahydrofolate cyclo-ligase
MEKAALRTALREVVIDDRLRTLASQRITDAVLNHPRFIDAPSITAFVGVRNEPDTTAILRAALDLHKTIYLPRVADRTRLAWHRIHDLHSFVTTPYGLLEPSPSSPSTLHIPDDVTLALVPGLAFASTGARLGHGRGYYDRALTTTTAHRLGVTLSRFLDPPEGPIPTTTTDVFMHAVLTERDLTSCPPVR